MSKKDAALYGRAIRQYYAYHSNGEHPYGLMDQDGYSLHVGDASLSKKIALEYNINNVLKSLLLKYRTPDNHKKYFKYKKEQKINNLVNALKSANVCSAAQSYIKPIKNEEVLNTFNAIEERYQSLRNKVVVACENYEFVPKHHNPKKLQLVYAKPIMLSEGIWSESFEKEWQSLRMEMQDLADAVKLI